MKTNPNDAINTFKGDEYTTPDGYTTSNYFNLGLTKREIFAAMALQGLCADPESRRDSIPGTAVKLADALIEALNKEKEK